MDLEFDLVNKPHGSYFLLKIIKKQKQKQFFEWIAALVIDMSNFFIIINTIPLLFINDIFYHRVSVTFCMLHF